MLPGFIIDEIRRRELEKEREKREFEQPRLELPLDVPRRPHDPEGEDAEESSVVILELS